MQGAGRKHPAALRCYSDQVINSLVVDGEKRSEHRRDQDRPSLVGLGCCSERFWVRNCRAPFVCLRVDVPDCVSERAIASDGPSELLGQLGEQAASCEFAAGSCNLLLDDLRMREVLEQCHDVGERLVKREDVGIGGFHEMRMHAVEESMGHFMGDHVVGKTREHHAVPQHAWVVGVRREVSEQQRLAVRAVIGVGLA